MSKIDRIIRVILALGIFGIGFYYGSWWGALGLIPLVTGAIGYCPLYTLIGKQPCPFNSCSTKKDEN